MTRLLVQQQQHPRLEGMMPAMSKHKKAWVVAVGLATTIFVTTIVLHSCASASTVAKLMWWSSSSSSWHARRRPREIEARVPKPFPLKLEAAPTGVESLIEAIRTAAQKAAKAAKASESHGHGPGGAGTSIPFSAKQQREWELKNPCQSRAQMGALYPLRKGAPVLVENAQWRRVLEEYAVLHRTCVRQMMRPSVTDFFLRKKTIPGCKFVVADTERGTGIGNKLLSIVSIFVYAVLTQRVMLVPFSTAVPAVMCEPFPGSSWLIDPELRNFTRARENPNLWSSVSQFYKNIDNCCSSGGANSSSVKNSSVVKEIYASRASEDWDCQPQSRFFCDTEQAHYTGVSWIYFREALYFVPKLFAVPSFRGVMEDLFPDRYVLPHLLRSILLPSDAVWRRVRQAHDAHFRHADTRLGIQVRYFHGRYDFDLLHETTENNIQRCVVEHKLLPDPESHAPPAAAAAGPSSSDLHAVDKMDMASSDLHAVDDLDKVSSDLHAVDDLDKGSSDLHAVDDLDKDSSNRSSHGYQQRQQALMTPLKVTTVFIASLYASLSDKLTELYVRRALETGDAVGIVQLTSETDQFFGVEVDRQALTEILCLSLCDHLILTPQSTFGALAQGYGALRPWFTDIRPQTSTACVRAQTPETCYQIPNTKRFSCPHDVHVHGKLISDLVPYITDCHLVEEPFFKVRGAGLGLQLLTNFSSDDNNNKQ